MLDKFTALIVVIVLSLTSSPSFAEDARMIDEATLTDWGYKTTSVSGTHAIKKIEKVRSHNKNYYPRFGLWKECFDTSIKVESRIKQVKEEKSQIRFYDYRQFFVKDNCIYFITTGAQYFAMEFQPKLLKLYKEYITSIDKKS